MHTTQDSSKDQRTKPTMYGLEPGEKIEVTQWNRGKSKSYVCTVIQEQKNFITVDRGNYKDTVDKLLVLQNEMEIERVEDMKKIEVPTKEKLLEMTQNYPTKAKAANGIAKSLKVSPATVYGWFKNYSIDSWTGIEEAPRPVNLTIEKTVDTAIESEIITKVPENTIVIEKSVQAIKLIVKTLQFDHLLIDIDRKIKNVSFIDEDQGQKINIGFGQLGAFAELAIGVKELIEKDK
ncbi:MAG: hypothetical protein K0R80_2888 [Clostridia bacterium]|jgi:hypothetical protein|nr:hypothetical protein [Clostridia bacterium]